MIFFLLIIGCGGDAVEPAGSPTPEPEVEEAPSEVDLSWLEGCWQNETVAECWMARDGGGWVGSGVSESGSEALRVVENGSEWRYLAIPPDQAKWVGFSVVSASDHGLTVENPDHDFPQRIVYTREGDTLSARISDLAGEKTTEFELSKVSADALRDVHVLPAAHGQRDGGPSEEATFSARVEDGTLVLDIGRLGSTCAPEPRFAVRRTDEGLDLVRQPPTGPQARCMGTHRLSLHVLGASDVTSVRWVNADGEAVQTATVE